MVKEKLVFIDYFIGKIGFQHSVGSNGSYQQMLELIILLANKFKFGKFAHKNPSNLLKNCTLAVLHSFALSRKFSAALAADSTNLRTLGILCVIVIRMLFAKVFHFARYLVTGQIFCSFETKCCFRSYPVIQCSSEMGYFTIGPVI